MQDHETAHDITTFLADLARQEVAPKTVASYRSDLAGFARWFAHARPAPR